MKYLLLSLLILFSPVSAKLDSRVVTRDKEICKGVREIEVLINNSHYEYYYDNDTGTNPINCFFQHYGIEGYTDRFGL